LGAGATGTQYYIVHAWNNASESGNSTMGVKTELQFTRDITTSNIAWFSLPYNTMYGSASDIAVELGWANVDLIGKWDPINQTSVYYYFHNGGWRGTDFAIFPGDGLYLGIVQSFNWVINGTDASTNLFFGFSPVSANVYWTGLPYTGVYDHVFDLVAELDPDGDGFPINEIGKWNPATQSAIVYYHDGVSWTGTPFAIAPGDGIYFVTTQAFPWTPALLTPEVP
jgi:hypothetical protein